MCDEADDDEQYEPTTDCPGCGLMDGHTEGCEYLRNY